MIEQSSIEEAGAASFGISGRVAVFDDIFSNSLQKALSDIVSSIELTTGGFLGHAKSIITCHEGTMGINIVNSKIGAELTGLLSHGENCIVKVMVAALDIEYDSLKSIVLKNLGKVKGLSLEERVRPNMIILE